MRTILVGLFFVLVVSVSGFAQAPAQQDSEKLVTFELGKDATLQTFLDFVYKECGINWVADSDVRLTQLINIRVDARPCVQVFQSLLGSVGLGSDFNPKTSVYRIASRSKFEAEQKRAEQKQQAEAREKARFQKDLEAEQKKLERETPPPPLPVLTKPTGRPDPLGLESQTVAASKKVPVVCAAAVEASKLPYVYGVYFGSGQQADSLRYGSPMGNIIQGSLCDQLLFKGYSPVVARTGFQAQSRAGLQREVSLSNRSNRSVFGGTQDVYPTETADYVVIPEIAFTTLAGNQKAIDGRSTGRVIGDAIRGPAGRIIRDASGEFGKQTDSRMVEAVLTVRFYDRAGRQVRTYQAAEKMSWKQGEEFRLAIIGRRSTNTPTLAPLAQKLVMAVAAKM